MTRMFERDGYVPDIFESEKDFRSLGDPLSHDYSAPDDWYDESDDYEDRELNTGDLKDKDLDGKVYFDTTVYTDDYDPKGYRNYASPFPEYQYMAPGLLQYDRAFGQEDYTIFNLVASTINGGYKSTMYDYLKFLPVESIQYLTSEEKLKSVDFEYNPLAKYSPKNSYTTPGLFQAGHFIASNGLDLGMYYPLQAELHFARGLWVGKLERASLTSDSELLESVRNDIKQFAEADGASWRFDYEFQRAYDFMFKLEQTDSLEEDKEKPKKF